MSEQSGKTPTVAPDQEAADEAGASPATASGEVPPDLAWAQGFHMAARSFAAEREASELHITITLASGESIPVMSVGPGGPPGFVGFGVETDGLRERIESGGEMIASPRGVYVPIGSIAKIEFSTDAEVPHAIGFRVDRALDEA